MSPDDPRHGTTAGFHAGCRCAGCRSARARYEKEGRLARLRGGRAVPALGAQRRIQALMWLGWTSEDIARAAGWRHRNYVLRILAGQKGKPCTWLERSTAERVAEVYERLSMTLPPPGPYRSRMRSIAGRKGYAPPLAWDDIDHDDHPRSAIPTTDALDDVAIDRRLAGDPVPLTTAEKAEARRRWTAAGRPLNELERVTGINSHRRYEEAS